MTPPVFAAAVAQVAVGDTVVVDGDEGHHAADVRRLRAGERVGLTDGSGVLLLGDVTRVGRGQVTVQVDERREVPRPQPCLVVVQALARGGRDEQAVAAMTEVGVDEVVGWQAVRNVAKWSDNTRRRWESAAHASAKQSRRAWWPTVTGPVSTADVAARCDAADVALVLHESGRERWDPQLVSGADEIVVVVGPEGGIDDGELDELRAAGGRVVRLGDNVLRSSTAGVAALAATFAATRWR